jgi:hypothetical protein
MELATLVCVHPDSLERTARKISLIVKIIHVHQVQLALI